MTWAQASWMLLETSMRAASIHGAHAPDQCVLVDILILHFHLESRSGAVLLSPQAPNFP
jgi:hypothetical protein